MLRVFGLRYHSVITRPPTTATRCVISVSRPLNEWMRRSRFILLLLSFDDCRVSTGGSQTIPHVRNGRIDHDEEDSGSQVGLNEVACELTGDSRAVEDFSDSDDVAQARFLDHAHRLTQQRR